MRRVQDHGFIAATAISAAVTAAVGFLAPGLLGVAVAGSFMAPVDHIRRAGRLRGAALTARSGTASTASRYRPNASSTSTRTPTATTA